MRKAAKIDENQPAIVGFFRSAGMSVAITSNSHDGFPDIVVGYKGVTVLVEIKDGSKAPSKRKLTPKQVEFHNDFTGALTVIESIDQAVVLVAKIRQAAQRITDIKW